MPVTPFVPAPSTVQVTLGGTYYGDTIINRLHFKKIAGGLVLSDIINLGSLVSSWFTAELLPLLSVDYSWQQLHLRDMSVANGIVYDFGGSGAPGGLAGQGLPGNVTTSVNFIDGYAHPGGKFGVRLSGLIEANVTGNTVSNLWRANVVDAFNQIFGTITAGGVWWFANVSKKAGGLWRSEAFVAPINSITIPSSRVHTMGKRVNGR